MDAGGTGEESEAQVDEGILIGRGEREVRMLPRWANRHGLIAGATGTGKSVSLMVLAEAFSRRGVPVFVADVKGDLAGLSQPGVASERITQRVAHFPGLEWRPEAVPVVFWDVFGERGHPLRTTPSEMGAPLIARMLELNDTQAATLDVAFRVADEEDLLLLDLDDLRALMAHIAARHREISQRYGLVSPASIAAIQRALLSFGDAGGKALFGEPALELADFLRTDPQGRGVVNVLAAEQLFLRPRVYATLLLWLLAELFETLPEVGDLERPKLVFFFDEAHLLFNDAPEALRERVEQAVRLIRSKGVGVYFVTQLPDDVPPEILGQLGHRIQHALRAFTPRDRKAVKAAAETFVPNPAFETGEVITQLGVGEALVSVLDPRGSPTPVERALIVPPRVRIGAIEAPERAQVRAASPIGARYDRAVDRESAAEKLEAAQTPAARAPAKATPPAREAENAPAPASAPSGGLRDWLMGTKRRQGVLESAAKSTARTIGNELGRQLLRGLFGTARRR